MYLYCAYQNIWGTFLSITRNVFLTKESLRECLDFNIPMFASCFLLNLSFFLPYLIGQSIYIWSVNLDGQFRAGPGAIHWIKDPRTDIAHT
jgi:hypothetical protein